MNPPTINHGRTRCLRTMRVLQRYLDGALDGVPAGRVAEHLEVCRRCGLEADLYRAIKMSLAGRDPAVDPQTLERLRRFGQRLARGTGPTGGDPGDDRA